MSKTSQSKNYADPTTENNKIESREAENNRTEKNKTEKNKTGKKNILEQFVKSKGTVTTF